MESGSSVDSLNVKCIRVSLKDQSALGIYRIDYVTAYHFQVSKALCYSYIKAVWAIQFH